MASDVPRMVRFSISGLIGTILFYLVYQGILRVLWFEQYKPTISWLVSYLLSIAWQMELHARLVYRTKIQNYISTLIQTYLAYGISIAVSTVLNFVLIEYFFVDVSIAWISSLIATGFLNYFMVSKIMDPNTSKAL